MNIRDLKYLVAVADLQNFRKAAELCNVSQPTLSMQIKKLEDYLQVTLIERTNKSVIITEAGRQIVEKAREVAILTDSIKRTADSFRNPYEGEMRLGAFPTLAPYYFPKILPVLREQFPSLSIYLVEEKTEDLIYKLKKAEIDAAFLALPINEKGLVSKAVFTEEFYLGVSKDHELADRSSITQDDMIGRRLMLLEEGHCLRYQALDFCTPSGVQETQGFRATSLATLRQMVANGVGITLFPEIARKKNDGIKYIKFKGNKPKRTIGLVHRKGSAKTKILDEMHEMLV